MPKKGPRRVAYRRRAAIVKRQLRKKIAALRADNRRLRDLCRAGGIEISKPKRKRAAVA